MVLAFDRPYIETKMASAPSLKAIEGLRVYPAVRWLTFFAPLLVFLCATFGYLHAYDRQHDLLHNDLIGRQFATRAVLHGADPYSPAMQHQIQAVAGHDPGQAFDYPILLAVLLAPVAALPWQTLRLTFLLVLIPALFLSFRSCVPLVHLRATRSGAFAIALLCLCSWPVVFALRMQQPTLLIAVLVLPACYLLSRQHQVLPAILLALSTFKPQLVLPLLLWLLLWSCIRRRWTLPVAFAITEALLFFCGERLAPGWFPHWLATLHRYRTLCPGMLLQLFFGRWLGLLGTLALVAWSFWRLWQLRHCSPGSAEFAHAIALVLAATLCMTPMIWAMIYNQVILVPAALLLLATKPPAGYGIPAIAFRATQTFLVFTFASVVIAALGLAIVPSKFWLPLPFLNHLLAPALCLTLLCAPLRFRDTPALPLLA
jgi:hypothetical protein